MSLQMILRNYSCLLMHLLLKTCRISWRDPAPVHSDFLRSSFLWCLSPMTQTPSSRCLCVSTQKLIVEVLPYCHCKFLLICRLVQFNTTIHWRQQIKFPHRLHYIMWICELLMSKDLWKKFSFQIPVKSPIMNQSRKFRCRLLLFHLLT